MKQRLNKTNPINITRSARTTDLFTQPTAQETTSFQEKLNEAV